MKTNKILLIILVFLLLISSVSASQLNYYDWEDGSGTTLTDNWGTDDGTITGMTFDSSTYPTFDVTGNGASYCGLFDATGEIVNLNNADTSTVLTSISYSVWVNPTSLNPYEIVAGFSGGGDAEFRHYIQIKVDNGYPRFRMRYDGTDQDLISGSAISTGTWTNIIGTWDGTDMTLYVNGVQKATGTFASGYLKNYYDFYIGANNDKNTAITYEFSGRIDEFKSWDHELTTTEINNIQDCGETICSASESEKFVITCENSTSEIISICNATIDTVFYSTTNGTINTNLYTNSTILHNITVKAENYFNYDEIGVNISTELITALLHYPKISLYNYITDTGIDSWTVEIDGTNYSTISNKVFIPFNTSKTIKTFVTDYLSRTVSHNFIDQNDSSINVWQSEISLSFTEKVTGNTLSNWELWDDGSKVAETTGTTTTWYANAGTYEDFTLKSKSSSFPDRSLDENLTVIALDEESFTDSVYLFEFNFNSILPLKENEAVTVPFNYTLDITENKVGSPEFDLKFYIDEVLYQTIEDVEDGDTVFLNVSESYFGEHNLSFKLIDEYNRESNILIDEVNFYGTVITITFLNEESESIDLVGDSFFSCTGIYPVASTLSPVTYYLDCIPDWYRFTQENSSLTRKITVQSGIYSTNIYLFDGTTDSFVVKPVEVGDLSDETIYILRNGNVLHAEVQNSQGRIYPMLRVGYEYDVAYKVGDEYIIIGNFIPLDDSIFILFANTYTLTEFDNTFYNDIDISYGFTGTNNSIYVHINDTVSGLTSARVQIYYFNETYIGSMDSTVTGEYDITFLHPLIDAERVLLNETDFKIIIDLEHDDYGSKTLTYYISKSVGLNFNYISSVTRIILGFLLFLVLVGLFSKQFEDIGLIISSSALMIFNLVGILSLNDVLVYSLGSLFFIIGIFLLIKKRGVVS